MMKKSMKILRIGLKQSICDKILLFLLILPFLIGVIFYHGTIQLNLFLEKNHSYSITSYYFVIDAFTVLLIPLMIGIASAFLLLEEKDADIKMYHEITPATKKGYFNARIVIPTIFSFVSTTIIFYLFHLSSLTIFEIIITSLISTFTSLTLTIIIAFLSKNKVEGLVYSKLTGLVIIGLLVPLFILDSYKYMVSFLPSFWIYEILNQKPNVCLIIIGVLISIFWLRFSLRIYKNN